MFGRSALAIQPENTMVPFWDRGFYIVQIVFLLLSNTFHRTANTKEESIPQKNIDYKPKKRIPSKKIAN